MPHIGQRAAGPHGVHMGGPRVQTPILMGGPVNQTMPANAPYSYPNPNSGPQGVQVGKLLILNKHGKFSGL